MKFFFPDSQDQVDPEFEFITEERDPRRRRIRQRDDLYAHEVLSPPPFDGLLVSKPIVDGTPDGDAGKYTSSQRHRLYADGARRFFRLDQQANPMATIGDCGAFSYANKYEPPYSVDQVIDFYEGCRFDYGISVDHIIFDYKPSVPADDSRAAEWVRRQACTLSLAQGFWDRCRARKVGFVPVGVAHGWSPASYADSVRELQRIGFERIALGGMVPLKTDQILTCLRAVGNVRQPSTQLHLLGISRFDQVPKFARHGVTSFDSTAPFRQAFKDDRDNYYATDRNYVAVRVPQVDGNRALRNRISSGEISQDKAIRLERSALELLRGYDRDQVTLDTALDAVQHYSRFWGGDKTDRTDDYRQTLADRPWRRCPCDLCKEIGIEIVLFRGSERNKRRGFHNLYVFRQRLDDQLGRG